MSFRTRLLLACLPLALAPLVLFGLSVRGDVSERLEAQDEARVAALADLIEEELARRSGAVAAGLDRLAESMDADPRLRVALLSLEEERGSSRAYLLDYAAGAMHLAGLDLLLLLADDGRVLSSGHFRNEYDRTEASLPAALERAGPMPVLAEAATPAGTMLALVRGSRVRVGPTPLTLVGGIRVDEGFLEGLARGTGLQVGLLGHEEAAVPAAARPTREVSVLRVGSAGDGEARFVVRASDATLVQLRRGLDRRLLAASSAAAALALLLAAVVSGQLARPLAELADRARRVELDRGEVGFPTRRDDEVGALARVLDRMTGRLRAGATRLREAERRATLGDVARQVNHDVRNGLVPIRNVVGHLADLARGRPEEMQRVFLERQPTLDSAIGYLQGLAASYARLSPALERQPCDLNALARQVVAAARREGVETPRLETDLAHGLPPVEADPVALRRVLENLVLNALESLPEGKGLVRVWTRPGTEPGAASARIGVTDSGAGMSPAEQARVFEDFFTTKPGGTGLGLSIVRRLVGDLGGRISLESAVGEGSTFTVELPCSQGAGAHAPPGRAAPAREALERRP